MNKLENKKIAILVEKMYEDLELWYPYFRMQEEGAKVDLIGPEAGKKYDSKHGYPAKTDKSITNVSGNDYDMVIIPGGYSPDHMRRNPKMIEFVQEVYDNGGYAAAICHGGWMLASADIIRNKKMTCYYSIKDDIENAGAKFIDEPVVNDGRIITSRNPFDLPHFCREIITTLAKSKKVTV